MCRDQAIDLELLAESIITHWKTTSDINWDTIILDGNNINQAQNEGGIMYYY